MAGPTSDSLRLRLSGALRNLPARARLLREIRCFFDGLGFLEVETPILVASPGVEAHLPAVPCRVAGGERFLITSPEFHMKRLVAAGLERIYQITRSFRDGERGRLHNPEFTILEWYRSNASYGDIMDDLEGLLHAAARALAEVTPARPAGRPLDLTRPFPRLTMAEAFERFAGQRLEAVLGQPDGEERFFRHLVEDVEPALERTSRPVFLVDWPPQMASLARLRVGPQGEGAVAERFELYAGGIELANGFSELTDPVEARARMDAELARRRELGLPVFPLDERYLASLEGGLPPTAGVAVGVDRLAMLLLGEHTLDAVMPFPEEWA